MLNINNLDRETLIGIAPGLSQRRIVRNVANLLQRFADDNVNYVRITVGPFDHGLDRFFNLIEFDLGVSELSKSLEDLRIDRARLLDITDLHSSLAS